MDILQIMVGTFLLSLAVEMFILPYNILSGGVAGIAVAIEPILSLNKTFVANALVIILLVAGGFFLGKEFLLETTFSSLLYPVFNILLERYMPVYTVDPLIASLYGGVVGGIGIGLVLRAGASTGGMDIPPLIIHKLTGIKIPVLIGIIDGLTVALGFLTYDLNAVLIGLLSVYVTSMMIHQVLTFGGAKSRSVQIISDYYQEICQDIDAVLSRGCTLLDATGYYQGSPRKIVLCVVSEKQYSALLEIINHHDPKAFVITTTASDIHGEGFSDIGFYI